MHTEVISLSVLTTTFCSYNACFLSVLSCSGGLQTLIYRPSTLSRVTPSTAVAQHEFSRLPAQRLPAATLGAGAMFTDVCIGEAQREGPCLHVPVISLMHPTQFVGTMFDSWRQVKIGWLPIARPVCCATSSSLAVEDMAWNLAHFHALQSPCLPQNSS